MVDSGIESTIGPISFHDLVQFKCRRIAIYSLWSKSSTGSICCTRKLASQTIYMMIANKHKVHQTAHFLYILQI